MVPKVVQDAGYTAVGLGVMAVQQVQTGRRAARAAIGERLSCLQSGAGSVLVRVKQAGGPLAAPVVAAVDSGRQRLSQALRLSSSS